ncbi:hypothetical protein FQZ97_580210 [compost metagenome]
MDWLIVPSLQTNLAPLQWAMPPFLPEHGVLPRALAVWLATSKPIARMATILCKFSPFLVCFRLGSDDSVYSGAAAGLSQIKCRKKWKTCSTDNRKSHLRDGMAICLIKSGLARFAALVAPSPN